MSDLEPKRESKGKGHGGPARGYSWPPFEKGNQIAVRHGAYSTLAIAPRADELAAEIRVALPVYSPADEVAVRLLAVTLARVERAQAALEKVDEASDGNELAAYASASAPAFERLRIDLRAWINAARKLADDLGMTPTSRARLGLDIASARRQMSVIEYYAKREQESEGTG